MGRVNILDALKRQVGLPPMRARDVRAPAQAVVVVRPDGQGRLVPAEVGGVAGGGGVAAPEGELRFLDPAALWASGYAPEVDGTLLVQNLCRDCHFEAYADQPPMLDAPPQGAVPLISVAPQSWAQVPVRGGEVLSLVMHGIVSAPHMDEVRLAFVPGRAALAAGPLPRHPSTAPAVHPPEALAVTADETGLALPAGATHATVHVVSGSVRRSIGGAPGVGTPGLSAGDSEEIAGAELAAYRLVRDGAADAAVYVEYRTVG